MFARKMIPAVLWALFILVICGIPGNKLPELSFWQWLKPDKVTHLVVFGLQSYLLLKAFNAEGAPQMFRHRAVLWALVLTIGYGVLTEILQTYVFIKRYGDVRDALANAAGAALGIFVFRGRQRKA